MDKIICLVGESGSGKSTIAEMLEKEGFNYIQSFTTRKPRFAGEKGHIFTDNIVFQKHKSLDKTLDSFKIIASTYFDGNYYWAVNTQYKDKGKSIYVIDPVGVKNLRENIKDAEIVVIYLKCDVDTRARRMFARKHDLKTFQDRRKSKYYGDILDFDEDILLRLDNDKEAFTVIQTDYALDANRIVEDVFKDIKVIVNF